MDTDRQGQIDYVRGAISVTSVAVPLDILSLSVRFAEFHDNDMAALEESGVADFLRLLIEVARSEGVQRKREAPARNLDHFVELVLGTDALDDTLSVKRVLSRLRGLEKNLSDAGIELDRRAHRATAAVLDRIGPMVAETIERHADDQNETAFAEECNTVLRQLVAEETRAEVVSLLASTKGALLSSFDIGHIPLPKFETITIKIRNSNRKTAGSIGKAGGGMGGGIGGAWAGAALGSVFPVVGTVVGGVVGTAVGTLFGSLMGGAAGEALGSDWEESMKSGDNRAAVEATTIKALQDAGQSAVESFFADLKIAVVRPVDQRAARIIRELGHFSELLNEKVHSNG